MQKIIQWSNEQFMKISPDKTEILLLHPTCLNHEIVIKGVLIDEQCIRFSNIVKNVGVWIDENLNMNKHINSVVSHCHKILRDIGKIKTYLQRSHMEQIVLAVAGMRLNYCNSLC